MSSQTNDAFTISSVSLSTTVKPGPDQGLAGIEKVIVDRASHHVPVNLADDDDDIVEVAYPDQHRTIQDSQFEF